jgi:hypothetical protein
VKVPVQLLYTNKNKMTSKKKFLGRNAFLWEIVNKKEKIHLLLSEINIRMGILYYHLSERVCDTLRTVPKDQAGWCILLKRWKDHGSKLGQAKV